MPLDTEPDPRLDPPPEGAKPVPDPCPACGADHCLHLIQRMRVHPPSAGSVAGAADKRLASAVLMLECRSCRASAPLAVEPGGTHARLPDPASMRPAAPGGRTG